MRQKLALLLLMAALLAGCQRIDVREPQPDYNWIENPWEDVTQPVTPPVEPPPVVDVDPSSYGDTASQLEKIQTRQDAGEQIHRDEVKALVGEGWRKVSFFEDGVEVFAWHYKILIDGQQKDASFVFLKSTGILKRTEIGF